MGAEAGAVLAWPLPGVTKVGSVPDGGVDGDLARTAGAGGAMMAAVLGLLLVRQWLSARRESRRVNP